MFYTCSRGLMVFLLWIINGNAHHHNEDKILSKDENYILVAPRRTWWDPVYMVFVVRPRESIFMVKKKLFTNRIFGQWIRMCGAFSIDRKNPGQKTLKYPINMLKKSNRSLMMFLGSDRHSTDAKGGVAVIVRMTKVKTMPVAYAGPMELKGLLTGEHVDMNFGNPINISNIKRMNDKGTEEMANHIQTEFNRLDTEDTTYHTSKKPNPLIYIYRIPPELVVIIVVLLTLLFSYIASFVWDPDRYRKMK